MAKKVSKRELKNEPPGDAPVETVVAPEGEAPAAPEAGEQVEASAVGSESPDAKAATGGEADADLTALREKAVQAEENWSRYLRATAELENYRKRATRERQEAARFANEALLGKLIPVLDSFEMAVQATNGDAADEEPQSSSAVRDGVRMILAQFKAALAEAGLEEIDATRRVFDPSVHEAVSTQESDEVEDGHVLHQVRKGYRLRERLLRPAAVVVARKPSV